MASKAKQHPAVEAVLKSGSGKVKVAASDIDGVLRGKYLHLDKFLGAVDGGFGFCDVVFGWDSSDNCYDNATMESFWSTLKLELVYRRLFLSRAEARSEIFDYIEAFYNRQRAHSALDYHSPVDFENQNN